MANVSKKLDELEGGAEESVLPRVAGVYSYRFWSDKGHY